jgi:hypothetical protein
MHGNTRFSFLYFVNNITKAKMLRRKTDPRREPPHSDISRPRVVPIDLCFNSRSLEGNIDGDLKIKSSLTSNQIVSVPLFLLCMGFNCCSGLNVEEFTRLY